MGQLDGNHVGGNCFGSERPNDEHRPYEEPGNHQVSAGDRQSNAKDLSKLSPVWPPESAQDCVAGKWFPEDSNRHQG